MTLLLAILAALAAELVLGLVAQVLLAPAWPGLRRAAARTADIWWMDRLLRPRTPLPAALGGVVAIAVMASSWRLAEGGSVGVGMSLFLLAPVPALALAACWFGSPNRTRPPRRSPG